MRLKAKIFMLAAVLVIAATLLSGCAGLKEGEISGLKELKPGLQDLWKKFTHEEEDNGQSWFSSKEAIYFWYSRKASGASAVLSDKSVPGLYPIQ